MLAFVIRDQTMEKMTLLATAAAGLEAIVGREIREMGYTCHVENGRVRFSGTPQDIFRCNVWLRAADRIKIEVGRFPAKNFEELFQGVQALPWESYLPLGGQFPITKAKSVKSVLHHEPTIQAMTKKAVASRLQAAYSRPRSVFLPETGAVFPIEVSVVKDEVSLLIDTSGSSLFKRGYRSDKGVAPIKENMAAAIVMLSNWYPDKPLIDPVCGSGTFCIEAAMLALNRAPGLERSFVCEEWDWMDKIAMSAIRQEARSAIKPVIELDISGSDIDPKMIDLAKANAQKAGVSEYINFKQMRLQDLYTDKRNGVIIANPPYGERLSTDEAIKMLYQEMGDVMRPLETWSKFILTSDDTFEGHFGQRADKKRKLYNGALRVDLYQFFGKRITNEG